MEVQPVERRQNFGGRSVLRKKLNWNKTLVLTDLIINVLTITAKAKVVLNKREKAREGTGRSVRRRRRWWGVWAAIMSTLFSIKASYICCKFTFFLPFLMMQGFVGVEIDWLANVCNFAELSEDALWTYNGRKHRKGPKKSICLTEALTHQALLWLKYNQVQSARGSYLKHSTDGIRFGMRLINSAIRST